MVSFNPDQLNSYARGLIGKLTSQRLLHDRLSMMILVPAAIINLVTLLLLLAKIHPTATAVPIRYSSLTGFESLGQWYQIYYIGLFGLGVTLINGYLAMISFHRSRITSFFLLIGAFVVGLFCLVISAAFAAIV